MANDHQVACSGKPTCTSRVGMRFQLFDSREVVGEKRLGVRQAVCGKVVTCVSEVGQEFGQPRFTCVLLYCFGEILIGCKFAGIGFLERLCDPLDLAGFGFNNGKAPARMLRLFLNFLVVPGRNRTGSGMPDPTVQTPGDGKTSGKERLIVKRGEFVHAISISRVDVPSSQRSCNLLC